MSGKRSLLTRLEYKLARFAVSRLILYIIGGIVIVYIADFAVASVSGGMSLYGMLCFDRELIFRGQVWRLLTYIFVPEETNIFFFILMLYFYYFIGTALENQWGTVKFNLFYFCGLLLTLVCGLITGTAYTDYLNLSMFLAFALLFPEQVFYIFFIIPVKAKWLGLIYAILTLVSLVTAVIGGLWGIVALIAAAVVNLILFFWPDIRWHFERIQMNLTARRRREESRRRYSGK